MNSLSRLTQEAHELSQSFRAKCYTMWLFSRHRDPIRFLLFGAATEWSNHGQSFSSFLFGGHGIMLRSDSFYKDLNNREMSRIENRKSII